MRILAFLIAVHCQAAFPSKNPQQIHVRSVLSRKIGHQVQNRNRATALYKNLKPAKSKSRDVCELNGKCRMRAIIAVSIGALSPADAWSSPIFLLLRIWAHHRISSARPSTFHRRFPARWPRSWDYPGVENWHVLWWATRCQDYSLCAACHLRQRIGWRASKVSRVQCTHVLLSVPYSYSI